MKNNCAKAPHPPTRAATASGFSLVEILVVISLIAVLSSVAILGVRSLGRSAGARGAADATSSLALAARLDAMSSGLGSWLIIDNGNDKDLRFRRLAVLRVIADPANPTQTTNQLAGRATVLQPNTYFYPTYSRGYTNMQVSVPGWTNPVIAYKFDAGGHLDIPQDEEDARLVFGPGPVTDSGQPESSGAAAARAGFLLRQNARPTFFSKPEQMEELP